MNYETHSKDISGLRARLQSASSRLRRKAVSFENPARFDLMSDSYEWVEFKEAIGFALLADRTIHGLPGNHPGATGAARPVVLGKISL